MGFLGRIALTTLISLAASFGFIKYAPLSWFDSAPKFGNTSITTINGSDNLSATPTKLNNNFSSLNANKVEISDLAGTTSLQQLTTLAGLTAASALASIGTITSGTWHGGIVFPTWGGTGSSTLSQYQVLLGNGTGAVTTPSGWGSSGQFLTSNGSGVAPSWQSASVNQTLDYTWTGQHTFDGATTTNLSVTNYLKWNNVTYKISGTQGASSTSLMTDGSGNLSWNMATSAIAMGTISTSTAGYSLTGTVNTDYTIVTGFQPSFVKLNYYVQGHNNAASTNVSFGKRGTAAYMGTTLVFNNITWDSQTGVAGDYPTPALGDFTGSTAPTNNGANPTAGVGNNTGYIAATLSILSVSSTGFTIRCNFVGISANTGRCDAAWEAYR